jgi:hypothetical protein
VTASRIVPESVPRRAETMRAACGVAFVSKSQPSGLTGEQALIDLSALGASRGRLVHESAVADLSQRGSSGAGKSHGCSAHGSYFARRASAAAA